jgi:glycosyltransferase involved in cell wall biosynthesis
VVYNGVDLEEFSPAGSSNRTPERSRILMVEGSLGGGYDLGLAWGIGLTERLHAMGLAVELVVAGKASRTLQETWQDRTALPVDFLGLVPLAEIPALDRSAHLLFAADVNAACPNSVIEALACGLPVVGLDTGALNEIVQDGAGEVAPYGGDPWNLDPPDLDGLARAAAGVLAEQDSYRRAARIRAMAQFGADNMVDSYIQALGGG